MKKTKIIVALVLSLLLALPLVLVACGGNQETDNRIQITTAFGYNNAATGIRFGNLSGITASGDNFIKMANGKTYYDGDYKPVWGELSNRMDIKFNDVYTSKTDTEEFSKWRTDGFKTTDGTQVDIVAANLTGANDAGNNGLLLNINDYLDEMPNYKRFLQDNPLVQMTLTADTSTGSMYLMPYFDGYDDIERSFLLRTDWVEYLLNGDSAFTHKTSNSVKEMNKVEAYTGVMPSSGVVQVDVAEKADGANDYSVKQIEKDYDAVKAAFNEAWVTTPTGNIADLATQYRKSAGATYDGLVNVLRKYIDVAYGDHYLTSRANLFTGFDAAWDADEMYVLTHCVVGQGFEFNSTGKIDGVFPRETDNNQRRINVAQIAAYMYGVRGFESRTDYLYLDSDGVMSDARQEIDGYQAALYLQQWGEEGLVDTGMHDETTTGAKKTGNGNYIKDNTGFLMYDYTQTQTAQNERAADKATHMQPVINPIALWNDGTGDSYMRFTESWRTTKPGGSCIPKGVAESPAKLRKVLQMFDYMYTTKGQVLMTYGPDEFLEPAADLPASIKPNDPGFRWATININGVEQPRINSKIEIGGEYDWTKISGKEDASFTNYARRYMGATMPVCEKMQSFEFQLTFEDGVVGANKISKAIELGLIKHVLLDPAKLPGAVVNEDGSIDLENANWWYFSVPTALPITSTQQTELNKLTNISGDDSAFSTATKQRTNIFTSIIGGKIDTAAGTNQGKIKLGKAIGEITHFDQSESGVTAFLTTVKNTTANQGWGGTTYLSYYNAAWTLQLNYYYTLIGYTPGA